MWRRTERVSLEKKPSIRLSQALRPEYTPGPGQQRYFDAEPPAFVYALAGDSLLPGKAIDHPLHGCNLFAALRVEVARRGPGFE